MYFNNFDIMILKKLNINFLIYFFKKIITVIPNNSQRVWKCGYGCFLKCFLFINVLK